MESFFLDTNVIIRFLTRDNPQQAQQARQLLERVADGRLTVTTSEGVVVEIVQVLSSKALYHLPRTDIRTHVGNILAMKVPRLPPMSVYFRALDLYAAHLFLDFVDALNVAHMERGKITTIFSFDRDFDRLPGVTRREA